MINDLDETIRQMILKKGVFAPDSVAVTFEQPTADWAAGLTRPTINCYLYDLRENLELRSAEWLVERDDKGTASKRPAPRRYDLSYLITVWTQNQVEDEHAILWRVLALLAGHPTLPGDACQGELKQQPYPILTQTAQPSMAIENMPDLWGVMENQLRPSINFVVTLAMEREVSFTAPLVVTRRLGTMPVDAPLQAREEVWQIAGIVHRQRDRQPIADAEVTLQGLGRVTHTDGFGRYSFGNLSAGAYHVLASSTEGKAKRAIVIPAEDHDASRYDLAI
jgi:hypothetical protein